MTKNSPSRDLVFTSALVCFHCSRSLMFFYRAYVTSLTAKPRLRERVSMQTGLVIRGWHRIAWSRLRTCAFAAGMLLYAAAPAMSLPPNPQRPNTSTTCAEAQERVVQAERGSSLISAHENAEVLRQASEVAARLCAAEPAKTTNS
jgi:hypothetical protein